MNVWVNGQLREIPDGLNVAGLLQHLGMKADRVAIERNLEILPRGRWEDTPIASDDHFEIVHLVGGG